MKEDLEKMTITYLKQICKEYNIKSISKSTKKQIVERILRNN